MPWGQRKRLLKVIASLGAAVKLPTPLVTTSTSGTTDVGYRSRWRAPACHSDVLRSGGLNQPRGTGPGTMTRGQSERTGYPRQWRNSGNDTVRGLTKGLKYFRVEIPSHRRGHRFNPYSAHHENLLKSKFFTPRCCRHIRQLDTERHANTTRRRSYSRSSSSPVLLTLGSSPRRHLTQSIQ